jgi:transcriptional repressor of cell division inhibition gene dicB
MEKQKAIEMLGGSVSVAAKRIGVSYQAVSKWPAVLSPRVADRVVAAVARKRSAKTQKHHAEA